jgi:glutaredoxin
MHVLLYTWSTCSFCARAKALLGQHGIAYVERALDGDRAQARRLARLFGSPTMPYVLIDGEPLGGLAELERWVAEREP